jgi:excisionase family DNA binding protein
MDTQSFSVSRGSATFADLPGAFDTAGACRYLSLKKTSLYEQIKAGNLEALKAGRRTIITRAACDDWLSRLPKSTAA